MVNCVRCNGLVCPYSVTDGVIPVYMCTDACLFVNDVYSTSNKDSCDKDEICGRKCRCRKTPR
jgi:hypothetical protein